MTQKMHAAVEGIGWVCPSLLLRMDILASKTVALSDPSSSRSRYDPSAQYSESTPRFESLSEGLQTSEMSIEHLRQLQLELLCFLDNAPACRTHSAVDDVAVAGYELFLALVQSLEMTLTVGNEYRSACLPASVRLGGK